MLSIKDLIILYDSEIGVIWVPEYGEVRSTTPGHAQLIEIFIQKAKKRELQAGELEKFTKYISNQFKECKKLNRIEPLGLREEDSLNRVEFVITNSCNLNCRYCYADGGSYGCNSKYISPEDADRYIDALFNTGYKSIKEVMFFGGEPTLFPDTIERICKNIIEKYEEGIITALPAFTMVTNGTLIDDNIANIIAKYHILVTISIDGPKEVNDRLRIERSGNGTYDKITAGIRKLRAHGVDIRLIEATYTTIHKQLGYSRESLKRYLETALDVKDVLIADCEDVALSQGYACKDKDELIAYVMQNAEQLISARLIKCMNSKPQYLDYSCDGGFSNLSIVPDGMIYPCHMYIGHEDYRIASLKDNKYVFKMNRYALMEKGSKHSGTCKECWARFYCSICPAIIALGEPSLDYMCQIERETQEKLILKYAKSMFLYNKNNEEEKYA